MNDEKFINMIHLLKTKYTNDDIAELITLLITEGSKPLIKEVIEGIKEFDKKVFKILKISPSTYMVENAESEVLGYNNDLFNLIKDIKVDKTTEEYKKCLELIESI